MYNQFFLILKRDLLGCFRDSISWFSMTFFILCIILFPIGMGVNSAALSPVAPIIVWVSALFANLLSLDRLYKEDFDDGTLQNYYVSGTSLTVVVLVKCLSHWIFTGLPIVIISPIIGSIINLNSNGMFALFLGLLLGTPILTLIGSPIAALTLGLSMRGPILAFICIPFMIPILVFGVSAVNSSISHVNYYSELYLLSAIISLFIILCPLATIKAIKISWE